MEGQGKAGGKRRKAEERQEKSGGGPGKGSEKKTVHNL